MQVQKYHYYVELCDDLHESIFSYHVLLSFLSIVYHDYGSSPTFTQKKFNKAKKVLAIQLQ